MLQSLPTNDSQRVSEAAFAFRKTTSRAEDHLVIEMLRELHDDTWETLEKVAGYDGQQKERQVDDERVPPNCNARDVVPFVIKDPATVGGPNNTHQTQPTLWPCPWSSGS